MLYFFSLIEAYFPKPRTSTLKKMNKFLLWLNFVHADVCDWNAFSEQWDEISDKSCMNYIDDVLSAILRAFKGTPQILDCPMTDEIRQNMFEILVMNEAKFANALLSIDGKASRMYGRQHRELRNFKFKFRAAQNHMHIYDRVLGLSMACSIGNAGHQNDIGIFNKHAWSNRSTLFDKLRQYLMFGDCGYVGADTRFVACRPRRNQALYHTQTREFWMEHSKARVHIEHEFGKFWHSQFPTLNFWKRSSMNAFRRKRINISCCVLIMNVIRLYRFHKLTVECDD